jgi:hypothetical protein
MPQAISRKPDHEERQRDRQSPPSGLARLVSGRVVGWRERAPRLSDRRERHKHRKRTHAGRDKAASRQCRAARRPPRPTMRTANRSTTLNTNRGGGRPVASASTGTEMGWGRRTAPARVGPERRADTSGQEVASAREKRASGRRSGRPAGRGVAIAARPRLAFLLVIGIVAAAIAGLGVAWAAGVTDGGAPTNQATKCREIMLYFSRGSGQDGSGPQLGLASPGFDLYQILQQRYGEDNVGEMANSYPAVRVRFSLFERKFLDLLALLRYRGNVANGVESAVRDLADVVDLCPRSAIPAAAGCLALAGIGRDQDLGAHVHDLVDLLLMPVAAVGNCDPGRVAHTDLFKLAPGGADHRRWPKSGELSVTSAASTI